MAMHDEAHRKTRYRILDDYLSDQGESIINLLAGQSPKPAPIYLGNLGNRRVEDSEKEGS